MTSSVKDKAQGYGIEALTQNELLTFMFGSNIGERLLEQKKKAMDCYIRLQAMQNSPNAQVRSSRDIYNHIEHAVYQLECEKVWLMLLTRQNRIISIQEIGKGGMTGCVVDVKLILKEAISTHRCANVVLIHNHPSGSTNPSQADLKLTQKVNSALELADLKLLDHIIATEKGYYSFADEGQI